jgi:hypothetical protein
VPLETEAARFALPSELFFAADLLRVFMHRNRDAPRWRATTEKLHVCYLLNLTADYSNKKLEV